MRSFSTPNEFIESDFLKNWISKTEAISISIKDMFPYSNNISHDYAIILHSNEREYFMAKAFFENNNEFEELTLELSKIEFNER
jgi:hypothetical protein